MSTDTDCTLLADKPRFAIQPVGLGDKFDRSMTFDKLLDNNAQLFICIS